MKKTLKSGKMPVVHCVLLYSIVIATLVFAILNFIKIGENSEDIKKFILNFISSASSVSGDMPGGMQTGMPASMMNEKFANRANRRK